MGFRQPELVLLIAFCLFVSSSAKETFSFTNTNLKVQEGNTAQLSVFRSVTGASIPVYFEIKYLSATKADITERKEMTYEPHRRQDYFDIPIIDDTEAEDDELFVVMIKADESYETNTRNIMIVTILKNDMPTISMETPNPTYESNGPLVLTAKRTIVLTGETKVTLEITTPGSGASATIGDDFTPPDPLEIVFADGEDTKSIDFVLKDDIVKELTEMFDIKIVKNPTVYNIDVGQVTAEILDDDVPTISLETPNPKYESNGPLVLTAKRTNGLFGEIKVAFKISTPGSGASATTGDDFTPPDPLEIVFADGENTKSIDFVLKDDIAREPTEMFNINIVKNPTVYNIDVGQVTAEILDDDGPATFDCQRPGQDCENGASCNDGVCDCAGLTPARVGYSCHYEKDKVDGNLCAIDTCTADGTCISDGATSCSCEPGYVGDKCELSRYKVVCGEDKMSIQIDPIGNFEGKVYAYEHEDSCTFADYDSNAGMPKEIMAGKVKTIANKDTACGDTTSVVTDNILRISRIIYVQYNANFQAAYDEFVRARCTFDLSTNAVLESVLSHVNSAQEDVIQSIAHGDLNPLKLGVEKEGNPITGNTPIIMGEELMVILTISPAKEFGALLVVGITLDNNKQGSDLFTIHMVKDSNFQTSAAGIISAKSGLTATTKNNVLKVEFAFLPPKFQNSDNVRIKFTAKLCPTGDTRDCNVVSNPVVSLRRKRATHDSDYKTVDIVIKVTDPLAERQLDDRSHTVNKQGSSPLDCANEVSPGIIGAICMMAVLLLLFFVTSIVLFFRLMRRSNQSKNENLPSSLTVPTKATRRIITMDSHLKNCSMSDRY